MSQCPKANSHGHNLHFFEVSQKASWDTSENH
jgi:hypothetical protein